VQASQVLDWITFQWFSVRIEGQQQQHQWLHLYAQFNLTVLRPGRKSAVCNLAQPIWLFLELLPQTYIFLVLEIQWTRPVEWNLTVQVSRTALSSFYTSWGIPQKVLHYLYLGKSSEREKEQVEKLGHLHIWSIIWSIEGELRCQLSFYPQSDFKLSALPLDFVCFQFVFSTESHIFEIYRNSPTLTYCKNLSQSSLIQLDNLLITCAPYPLSLQINIFWRMFSLLQAMVCNTLVSQSAGRQWGQLLELVTASGAILFQPVIFVQFL
jgi:hypothetical protein